MRKFCIIQARLGSSRLPAKVLKPIMGRPMLSYMIERVKYVKGIDGIVIATTTNESDMPIVNFCLENSIAYFRGSETDVMDRYYQTAKLKQADIIIRLTADCPLIDPEVVEDILRVFCADYPNIDFAGNVKPATFPDGLDTEVFSFSSLERAWNEAKLPLEREHVTPYFYDQEGRFRTRNITAEKDYSNYRITVDHQEDFDLVSDILQALYKPGYAFNYEEIIRFLDQHPEIKQKNSKFIRNPWYVQYQKEKK